MANGSKGYCDLVMKGGIASGIVYPNAVLELAKHYRFRNIGGTSAGAIAAAATAAAALGERRKRLRPDEVRGDSGDTGFEGFAATARALGREGFIPSLFQPVPAARPAIALLLAATSGAGRIRLLLAALRMIVGPVPLAILAALLAVAAWAGGIQGAAVMLLPALTCAIAAGVVLAAARLGRTLRGTMLGLCPGITQPGRSDPALSDWLHGVLQRLSGQAREQPLLFRHLWEAPREESEPGGRTIGLEMITTSISHGEPRSLPLQKVSFWFRREDFLRLFPTPLVDWMAGWREPISVGGETFHRLPTGGDMPVLVAMRMSLSFPILLSAVPLYEAASRDGENMPAGAGGGPEPDGAPRLAAIDALAGGGRADAAGSGAPPPSALRPCWFSDGGISSNLPLHLFDAPLPRWPTFAIDLVEDRTPRGAPSPPPWLPKGNAEGWRPHYRAIASGEGLGAVASFLIGIVTTMQNWRDVLQSRAPGHRDRIVRVPMKAHEGGIHLDMDQEVLDSIADKGSKAGIALITRFDFNNHWWIRWRNSASAIERFTIRFAAGAGTALTPSYEKALSSARTGEPPPPSYGFKSRAERAEAQARFAEMERQGLAWSARPDLLTEGAPKPLPELRIVPIF